MTVILSMKTFQRLEEKLGSESAKEVYELAEAIYEEVEKKFESKLEHFELSIKDTDSENLASKSDLISFRKEIINMISSFKDEQKSSLQINLHNFRRSFGRVTFLLIINMILILLILGYLVKPLILNGG